MRVALKADTMSLVCGLNTHEEVTSRKVASQKVMIGVAHFVSQKETKRMAMHVYDMLTIHIAYMVNNETLFKAKDIARRK